MSEVADTLEERIALLHKLPDAVRIRCALVGDELYASEDVRGEPALVSLAVDLAKLGVADTRFISPGDFDADYARYASRRGSGDNEIQQIAIDMIARAHKQGATDIHIEDKGSFVRIRFRILGMLKIDSELGAETGRRMIRVIYEHLGAAQDASSFDVNQALDARIVNKDFLPQGVFSVRIHAEPIECDGAANGVGTFMPLRLLCDTSGASGTLEQRLSKLGFTSEDVSLVDAAGNTRIAESQTGLFRRLANKNGIVLISGCTGSGKSTVLAHCMEAQIEERPYDNFISIEDPPEKPIAGMHQIRINSKEDQQRVGGISAYTRAIAGTNRDDADTVMIGEIRYADAALATIDVALSGNQVWGTIHASDAFGILQRLDVLLKATVAEPLRMVCDDAVLSGLEYQRLIARLCPHCKRPLREKRDALPAALLARIERVMPHELIFGDASHDGIFYRNAEGCPHCANSGHPGLFRQTVVAEVIALDSHMLRLLRDGKKDDARSYWLSELKGMTYLEHARHYVASGIIDPAVAEDQLSMPLDYDCRAEVVQTKNAVMPSSLERHFRRGRK